MNCKNPTLKSCLLVSMLTFCASAAIAIDVPTDPRGTELGQSRVKWEWAAVPGADVYEVVVDGTHVDITRDPQYYSFNLWAGEHSLTVRAKSSDGTFSQPTPTVKILVNEWFSTSNYNRSFIVGQEHLTVSAAPVVEASALSIPVDVRGTAVSADTIKWEWAGVSGASTYDVSIDGVYGGTTKETNFTSYNLWAGDHSMSVLAKSESGVVSERSATAKVWVSGAAVAAAEVEVSVTEEILAPAPPSPVEAVVDAASIQSFVDPASYGHDEVYSLTDYELVFSDEFEGTSLNPYRWNTGLRWDGEYNGERYEYRVVNGEDQFYVNIFSEDDEHIRDITPSHNPFEFDGSNLAIRAIKNPLKTNNGDLAYGSMREMVSQQNFLSGAITTHDKFSQKYGYFEARIKIPSVVGSFPAFWLFHENRAWEGTQRSEIDIMENLGHAPWYVYNSFHYFKNVTATSGGDANFLKPYPSGQVYTGTDYSQDFHVYAVEWEPNKVTWMIDGVKVSELEHSAVDFEELYVKLNLAMGGNWTNYPSNSGGLGRSEDQYFPNQDDLDNFSEPRLEIDYVRVYKKR